MWKALPRHDCILHTARAFQRAHSEQSYGLFMILYIFVPTPIQLFAEQRFGLR